MLPPHSPCPYPPLLWNFQLHVQLWISRPPPHQAPVVQRLGNFIRWISHYLTVSICAKISVFPYSQANMNTLTRAQLGSVRKPWTTFNLKYSLDAEEWLIQRIKLSSLWTTGAWIPKTLSWETAYGYFLELHKAWEMELVIKKTSNPYSVQWSTSNFSSLQYTTRATIR